LTVDGPDRSNGLLSSRKVHADQVDIDTPLVRELVAAQFPQWAALPLEPVDSSGLVNAVYRLGTDLSVRLPLRPTITDEVRREQAKLAALAPFLPVAIPSVEAIGSPTDAFPGEWSVHRWLSGTNPSPDALADPRRLATDLAAFVDAFRRIDLPDRPPAYPGERRTRAPMVSMDSSTRKAIGELDGLIDTRAALAPFALARQRSVARLEDASHLVRVVDARLCFCSGDVGGRLARRTRGRQASQKTAQNQARDRRQRIEVNAEGPAAVAGPATLDDSRHRGARVEPDGKLGRLEADDEIRPFADALVRE